MGTDRRPGLWPTLAYHDAPSAIRFLVDAFGFRTGVVHEGPGGDSVAHAELRWPEGGGVMVHSAESRMSSLAEITPHFPPRHYPAFAIHVDTRDPDSVYARALAADARIVRELADSPHGPRGFVAADPEGVFWSFGTPLEASD